MFVIPLRACAKHPLPLTTTHILQHRRSARTLLFVCSEPTLIMFGANTHTVVRGARAYCARGARAYDVLVVGGGVMGAWTAAIAARQGASVALTDQYEPAHDRGSSHGDGRIYRLAYHQEHYVNMMLHSLPLWQ